MKEKRIRMTKKQAEQLLNQHIGTGVIFYKSADNETVTVEFYGSPDGTLKTINGSSLNLESDIREITDREEIQSLIEGGYRYVGKNRIYYDKDCPESPFAVEEFEFYDEYKGTNEAMYSVLDGFADYREAYKAAKSPSLYRKLRLA